VTQHTHGLRAWLLQRASSIYLGGFLVYVSGYLLSRDEMNYPQWQAWLSHPLMSVASAAFVLAVLVHGWVGMRDIILDYVHVLGLRLLLLSLVGLLLAGCGLWGLRILVVTSA